MLGAAETCRAWAVGGSDRDRSRRNAEWSDSLEKDGARRLKHLHAVTRELGVSQRNSKAPRSQAR